MLSLISAVIAVLIGIAAAAGSCVAGCLDKLGDRSGHGSTAYDIDHIDLICDGTWTAGIDRRDCCTPLVQPGAFDPWRSAAAAVTAICGSIKKTWKIKRLDHDPSSSAAFGAAFFVGLVLMFPHAILHEASVSFSDSVCRRNNPQSVLSCRKVCVICRRACGGQRFFRE